MLLMCGLFWRCGRGRHSRLELRRLALRKVLLRAADPMCKASGGFSHRCSNVRVLRVRRGLMYTYTSIRYLWA